jgi:hypothetical protein
MTIERIGKKAGVVPGEETDGYRIIIDEAITKTDGELIIDAVNLICANTQTRLRHALMEKKRPTRIEIRWGTAEEKV